MGRLAVVLLAAVGSIASARAQMAAMPGDSAAAASRPVTRATGIGNAHHLIRTRSPETQRLFDQGLNYIFAFNHEEARRSFARAAEIDPTAPMPLWGVALAVGPNYNDIDIGHAREQTAGEAARKAEKLAANGPAAERDFVATMVERYGGAGAHDLHVQGEHYSRAMRSLAAKYPADLDAATLYAESLMDLNPWKLWGADGKPAPNTEAIVATLEGVLRRNPNHVGANHLLIHALEASPHPGEALASARRIAALAPSAGHLVHMPAHIYQRVGDFNGSARANEAAARTDQAYFASQHLDPAGEMYYDMYYVHNIHFLASACSMEGNRACTDRAAEQLTRHVLPAYPKDHMVEWFLPTGPWMMVRFGEWDRILFAPAPAPELRMLGAMWHYARGCALIAKGKLPEAKAERDALAHAEQTLPEDTLPDFQNSAESVLKLALLALDARLAEAGGKRAEAIEGWRRAVALLDTFAYNEPADWYYPVRESLGGALLRAGKAAEAEQVFRRDLQLNSRNPRSLFGLAESLRAQGHAAAADSATVQFRKAWTNADMPLRIQDL